LYTEAQKLAARNYSYSIVRSGYDYYVATVFSLPGCKTDGKTIEAVKQNMEVAKADYIYALLSLAQPVPDVDSLGCHVIITPDNSECLTTKTFGNG